MKTKIEETKVAQSKQSMEASKERLIRCIWHNLAILLIFTSLIGGITVYIYGLGQHANVVFCCAAVLGLFIGWMAGLCGALIVISSPKMYDNYF